MVGRKHHLCVSVCPWIRAAFFHWNLVLYCRYSPTGLSQSGHVSPACCSRKKSDFGGRHGGAGTPMPACVRWVSPFKTEFLAISLGPVFLTEPLFPLVPALGQSDFLQLLPPCTFSNKSHQIMTSVTSFLGLQLVRRLRETERMIPLGIKSQLQDIEDMHHLNFYLLVLHLCFMICKLPTISAWVILLCWVSCWDFSRLGILVGEFFTQNCLWVQAHSEVQRERPTLISQRSGFLMAPHGGHGADRVGA